MAGLKAMAVLGLVFWAVSLGGKWAAQAQQVHHVVGGDRGWDPSTGIASWSSGRVFKVGDQICESLSIPLPIYTYIFVPVDMLHG